VAQGGQVRRLMRLTLARHGQTDHNRSGLTLGRFDVPLNAHGRAQAHALALSFTLAPDAIYTSPLSRAYETAAIIARATGRSLEVEAGLTEMDVGEMEHLSRHELRERYPEFLQQWLSDAAGDARMSGGETLAEVQDRAWFTVAGLYERHPEGRVVAVTHNFVILMLVCRALGLPLGNFRRLRHGLAARTVLDIRSGDAALLQMNDNAHLLARGLGGEATESEARR
jgi:broad specificity phosphatase PhoE